MALEFRLTVSVGSSPKVGIEKLRNSGPNLKILDPSGQSTLDQVLSIAHIVTGWILLPYGTSACLGVVYICSSSHSL